MGSSIVWTRLMKKSVNSMPLSVLSRHACALTLVAASWLLACESKELVRPQTETYCDVVKCPASCENLEFFACDIADESCRASVQKSVECVRGIRFEHSPDVELVFPEMFDAGGVEPIDASAESEAGAEPELHGDYRVTPLRVAHRDFPSSSEVIDHHWSEALQSFGLLAPDLDWGGAWDESSRNVAGRYQPMDQVLEVVVFSERNAWREMSTLAHEMVHALQDQERGLDDWWAELSEAGVRSNAYRAFVEGEAQLYQLLALHLMLDLPFSEARLEEIIRKSQKSLLRAIAESESPAITAARASVYSIGSGLHFEQWKRRGIEGVDHLARDLPRDLAAWMRRDTESTTLDLTCEDVEPVDEPGLWAIIAGSVGADFVLPLLVKRLHVDGDADFARAWTDAAAWRGDCLQVVGQPFTPAAPLPKDTAESSGADAGGTPAVDAGAAPTDAAAGDAGLGSDLSGWRMENVVARWTIAFADEDTAERVADAFTTDPTVMSERQGTRVVLDVRSDDAKPPRSILAECWPLYPLDPNEMYLLGAGVSHWQYPEFALGSTRDISSGSIREDGELLFSGKRLFTPDWCRLPNEEFPDTERSDADADNDLWLPAPCDPPTRAQLGVQGQRLHHCPIGDAWGWIDGAGQTVLFEDLGELEVIGHEQTLLLSTGVFHRGSRFDAPPEPPHETPLDAGPDAGERRLDAGVTHRIDVPEGSWFGFIGALAPDEIRARRALPDGYWVATQGTDDPRHYSLWQVDFEGHADKLVDYAPLPDDLPVADIGVAKLDAYGTLFVVTVRDAAKPRLFVQHIDGQHEEPPLDAHRRLATGP